MKQYRVDIEQDNGRWYAVNADCGRDCYTQATRFYLDSKKAFPDVEIRLMEREVGE